jgi:hypothetical protein
VKCQVMFESKHALASSYTLYRGTGLFTESHSTGDIVSPFKAIDYLLKIIELSNATFEIYTCLCKSRPGRWKSSSRLERNEGSYLAEQQCEIHLLRATTIDKRSNEVEENVITVKAMTQSY